MTTFANVNDDVVAVQDTVSPSEQAVRDKILHVLSIYPRISVSMLQIGVGTSVSPGIWKPILDQLVKEGAITQTSEQHRNPSGRELMYTILSLTSATAATAATAATTTTTTVG